MDDKFGSDLNDLEKSKQYIESVDVSSGVENKEKRLYNRYNNRRVSFFTKKIKELEQEQSQYQPGTKEYDQFEEEKMLFKFRKAEQKFFQDIETDFFEGDQDLIQSELDGLRRQELRYIRKQLTNHDQYRDDESTYDEFRKVLLQAVSSSGIDENDKFFQEKIQPVMIKLIAQGNHTQESLMKRVEDAKLYNEDNYREKVRNDIAVDKAISRATDATEEFREMFGFFEGATGQDFGLYLYENYPDEVFGKMDEDWFQLYQNGLFRDLPWLEHGEYGEDLPKGWNDEYFYTWFGVDRPDVEDINQTVTGLRSFMDKYKDVEQKESSDSYEQEKEEILFDDWDSMIQYYRQNFGELGIEKNLQKFKEELTPEMEKRFSEYFVQKIKYEIRHRISDATYAGNIKSLLGEGHDAGFLQRLIAVKTGSVPDFDTLLRTPIPQIAKKYFNIDKLPEGYEKTFSQRPLTNI